MFSLYVHLYNNGWHNDRIQGAFECFADETQTGMNRVDAFVMCFPGVDPMLWIGDGLLSQYYCGPDRDYDIS